MALPPIISEALGGWQDVHLTAEDPAFHQGTARDPTDRREVRWQLLLGPNLELESGIGEQLAALSRIAHPRVARYRNHQVVSHGSLWISDIPEGRWFSQIPETLRDEVYLDWMEQALNALDALHREGWLHLGQNETSWRVCYPDDGGVERFYLTDLSLFPPVVLGQRVQAPALVAVAPELWSGEPLDARTDLYALACLFLRQRSRGLFSRFDTPKKLLELHRGGRVGDFVPKTPSRLNDLLRRMLQSNPADRPASASACLAEIRQEESSAAEVGSYLAVRAARRQETLIFTTLHSLLQEKELTLAQAWLEEIRPRYLMSHAAYLDYFDAYLGRHLDFSRELEGNRRPISVSDPKLKVLFSIEKATGERREGHLASAMQTLNHAWKDAKSDLDPELQARVLLKRSRLFREEKKQLAALEDLYSAYEKIQGIPGGRLRQAVAGDLADLSLQHGLNEAAYILSREALELAPRPDMVKASLQVLLGISLAKLERWEEAELHFSEAKSTFGVLKRLDALIWASAHELRVFLTQGDYTRAKREWRMLQARAKNFPLYRKWLALVHALVWMECGELPAPGTEREVSPLIKSSELADFVELGWGREDTCRLLARLSRRLGREDLFLVYSLKAERLQEEAAPVVKKFEKAFRELQGEAGKKITDLEKPTLREKPKLSPEDEEKKRIEEVLRRHKGNREKTAKELGINRRTLFAKIEKYSLKDLSFLPSREEILAILETCGGKKNEAAKKLKMSRATFYRHLKDLGLT